VTDQPLAGALLAADIAESKKGERVVVLDMREVTLIADYFVIVTALNLIQSESIADAVREALAARGMNRLNQASGSRSHWVLMDFGSVVVHIFTEDERSYYNLERLWGDAGVVDRESVKVSKGS
jgi:ribosome-associated protein